MNGLRFLFFAWLAFGFGQAAQALEFERFSLDNGMDVIVVPDHRAPVVVHMVWYRAGAADEVAGKTGLAHMLEHMMFKGTEKVPPQEFSKIVARHGGQDNAFTSYDYTAYYQKIARANLPKAMELEADRMSNLAFRKDDFYTERDVILEERRMRTDSKPVPRFFEDYRYVHMDEHPYGRPVIGWEKDIHAYTHTDALNWYKQYYRPNNATMILVGDITAADARPLVERYYGSAQAKPFDLPIWQAEPPFVAPQRLEKVDEEVQVPLFVRSYRAPSAVAPIGSGDRPELDIAEQQRLAKDTAALALLAEVFGGSQTSRLYETLVKTQELADSASADYDRVGRSESSFDIIVQPKPGVTLATIEAAVAAELARLTADGVQADELARARTRLVSRETYARDDLFVTAYRLGIWVMAGGEPAAFDAWLTMLEEVSTDDVVAAAERYLQEDASTTGYLAASREGFGNE